MRALAAVTAVIVIAAAAWWFSGRRVWTDGELVRVADRDVRPRQILWGAAQPVAGLVAAGQAYEPSVSPDGDEFYFVLGKAGGNGAAAGSPNADIYVSYRRNGAWATPVPLAEVNSPFDDLGPRLTGDGKFLLFYSNRPGGYGGYDLWAAARRYDDRGAAAGWGTPFNLGPTVNSAFDEYSPAPSPDGRLLFFATNRTAAQASQNEAWHATIRANGSNDFDLWMARREESAPSADVANATTRPAEPRAADTEPTIRSMLEPRIAFAEAREVPGVNTTSIEGASCMSPAGDFLYFTSDRPGGYGKFDLYRCRVHGEQFGPVENLGPSINTPDNETDPQLALGGFRLYFSSDRMLPAPARVATNRIDAAALAPDSTTRPTSGPASQPASPPAYALLQSDSREVYLERIARPLPRVGATGWIFAASLVALIPLVMLLRRWDGET